MSKLKRPLAFLLCALLTVCMALPASAAGGRITHGTADQWISEDQLSDSPPESYTIDPMIQGKARTGAYNAFFLKDGIQTVSIRIDENNLNYLLQNAADEPYVMTQSVTIGSSTVGYCGLRTKGNYTLYHSYHANPGSDRFSFTVNFGKYITAEGYGQDQNFYGVDKISFNNFFFDKSMMKEFFALELMEQMGLPTPRHGIAKLYINGDYYGVYAMVEALDSPILEQYYGCGGSELSSYLCKPTGTNLIYGQLLNDPSPLYEYSQETHDKVADMMPTVMEWVRRLNCLSTGTDFGGNALDVNSDTYLELLAQVMDIDETVRYFAVHSWLCQMDNMFVEKQNFGLYISPEGISTLIPWDYDLSFGCFYPSSAEATANFPLDVMFRTDVWDRLDSTCSRFYSIFPLFHVIYQNDSLMERYHGYMADCSKIALLGGTVEATGKVYNPGYFCSLLESMQEALIEAASEPLADNVYYMNRISQPRDIKNALPNLKKIIALRSVGVWNQVTGTGATVCASGCDLEALGNGIWGESSTSGLLTVVDPASGIFITSEFKGNRRSPPPALSTTVLEAGSSVYDAIEAQLEPGFGDTLLVYQNKLSGNPGGGFTVSIPLTAEHLAQGSTHTFYCYSGGKLTALDMTREDNLFTGSAPGATVLVVLIRTESSGWLLPAAAIAALTLLLATALLLRRRRKTA